MTTAPAARPPIAAAARPPQPGASAAAGAPAVTLDPIKLVKKYLWVLIGAGVLGVVLGVAIFLVWSRVAPSYRSFVIFEATVPKVDVGQAPGTERFDEKAMDRFIGTQLNLMRSDAVLEDVAANPRLAIDAPSYASQFMVNGTPDIRAIRQDLQERVGARAIPETYFLELSCTAAKPQEATILTGLVKQAYMTRLGRQSSREQDQQRAIIRRTITDSESEIESLRARRARLIQESNFDTLDERTAEVTQTLARVTDELVEIGLAIEATMVQLGRFEQQLASPTGITYDDEMISMAEADPRIARVRGQLDDLETSLRTLRESGFSDEHRDVVNIKSAIRAAEARADQIRQEVLRQVFEARVEGTRRTVAQLEAQRADLESQRDEMRASRNELTRIATQVDDLTRRITGLEEQRTRSEIQLENLEALASRDAANRVIERFPERLPDGRASPRLRVVGPLTVFVVVGLTAGLIVLRELLDQRVKGPADVAMIPRTRILGVIPSTGEDPSRAKRIETVFRDDPRGVLAEHFRQLRGQISKRLAGVERPSLVVIPCSPGSGASTMVANLGLAFAATGSRTLLIDANFRRPHLHAIFDMPEGPGLGEALAGTGTVAEAVRRVHASDPLDVLPAGAVSSRRFELLATREMSRLIAEAKGEYDVVIIDAPPALVAGDGSVLASKTDASILVARAMNEKRGMVARLKNEVAESRGDFLGVVVNDVRSAAGGYMRRNIRLSHRYHEDAAKPAPEAPKKKSKRGKGDDDDLIPDSNP